MLDFFFEIRSPVFLAFLSCFFYLRDVGTLNSYLTADPNSPESGNVEDNIAFIKPELLVLKSFNSEELYSLFRNMD